MKTLRWMSRLIVTLGLCLLPTLLAAQAETATPPSAPPADVPLPLLLDLFGPELLPTATRVGCAGQCSPTRIECNNLCFCFGCASASYSCTDTGGGCEATCTCLQCGTPNWCWDSP